MRQYVVIVLGGSTRHLTDKYLSDIAKRAAWAYEDNYGHDPDTIVRGTVDEDQATEVIKLIDKEWTQSQK